MKLRLVIADDSPLARSAIATVIGADPAFDIVGEARDGYEALQLVRTLHPDMVLLDLNMPRCDGLLATRLIKRQHPSTIVIILTVSDDAVELFEAMRGGAQGYLLKTLNPADWVAYLRSFAEGQSQVSSDLASRILASMRPGTPGPPARSNPLTDRENTVLRLVGQAMTNREIGETLMISEQTVKNHLKNMLQKLQLRNRVDLALYARRHERPDDGAR